MVWDVPKLCTLFLFLLLLWCLGVLYGLDEGLDRGAEKHCAPLKSPEKEECEEAFKD